MIKQNSSNAVFVSTTQAASQLSDFGDRVIAADPMEGSPVSLEANGIHVEAIYMSHSNPPNDPHEIFNNAYAVTRKETTFFHTGDINERFGLRRGVKYTRSNIPSVCWTNIL